MSPIPTREPGRVDADAPGGRGTGRTGTARDPWLDNAKLLLVTLVVVGHTWTLLAETVVTAWIYNFLYLWHIPAFVVVTGYLSRSFTWSRPQLTRLVTGLVVPYLVFEYSLTTFRQVVGGEQFGPLFWNPHWPMWYLASLLVWRLATPLLRRVPHVLPLAVVVSLATGVSTGDPLDLARTGGLLPFFVLGLLASPEQAARLRRTRVRVVAVAALVVAAAVATLVENHLGSTEWLYWRSSYDELHVSLLVGVLGRLALLAGAGVLALSVLALVPTGSHWFTRYGHATLVVYLLHGFVVKTAAYSAFPGWSQQHPLPSLVVATAAAVAVALTLAAPPVAQRLSVLVDPVAAWSRRRRQATSAGSSSRPPG
ncbi:MAG: acyltransferase family protein [Nocardioidaceae bacterium]